MDPNDNIDNVTYWGFSDDRAGAHKSCYYFIKYFLQFFDGIYNPISANTTALSQVADDPLCNGEFKRIARRKGRNFMKQKIIESVQNNIDRKKVIGKVNTEEMDRILGETMDEINTPNGIRKIQKAFERKLNPNKYDINLRKQLQRWEQIKNRSEEELFPDKQNYWNNIKLKGTPEYPYKDIPECLLNYKDPKKGYYCKCGWMHSNKYGIDRIEKHNKDCPVHSQYGIVPAYEPNDTSDPDAYLQEFIGYKERLEQNKCMFKLEGRCIEYSDEFGDHEAVIAKDIGNGFIIVKETNNRRYLKELKTLRYHDTVKIWRNY